MPEMTMMTLDELRRRLEVLEHDHSGIGSEVAVVKAEVGTMQRDINFVRSSVDTMGVKLDSVLTSLTSIQALSSHQRPPRDPIVFFQTITQAVVGLGLIIGMVVAAVSYVSHNTQETELKQALLDRLSQSEAAQSHEQKRIR
jgi:hypothetical protein